jgi:hypothetical protein
MWLLDDPVVRSRMLFGVNQTPTDSSAYAHPHVCQSTGFEEINSSGPAYLACLTC